MAELYFRQKVDAGLHELDDGTGTGHKAAKERLMDCNKCCPKVSVLKKSSLPIAERNIKGDVLLTTLIQHTQSFCGFNIFLKLCNTIIQGYV